MSAGRITSPLASRRTAPCICPEKPTQAISFPPIPDFSKAFWTAMPQALHQSRGSCSAHLAWGEAKGLCSSVPETTTLPCSSMMRARVAPVPTSIPRSLILPPFRDHRDEWRERGFCLEVRSSLMALQVADITTDSGWDISLAAKNLSLCSAVRHHKEGKIS